MNDVKNIVLISDQSGSCVDSVLATGLYNIKLLVVPYKKNVIDLKEKYGDKIEKFVYFIPNTNSEFQTEFHSDYNLTYEEIEKYRSAQLKCYRYNGRSIIDDNANNCIYYTALKFFLGYFNENKIDIVFSRIIEHGSISDSLIFEIAKGKNIPVYILSMNTGFNKESLMSIVCFNNKSFVDVSEIFKKQSNYDELLKTLNNNYSNNNVAKLPFSKLIKKFFSKKNKTLKSCFKWLYEYKIKIFIKNIKYSLLKDVYRIREETSLWQRITGFFYVHRLKSYYRSISTKKIFDENFIFFPLHMEPEAANLARPTMGCQLFVIEQVSQLLPDGYYLYVKEHPDQFASVQLDKYYYKGLKNFRNLDFYKRISKLKNVKIINVFTSSSNLIDKSKAVLSIAGSALIESVAKGKPIIVFGNGVSYVELLRDSFNITDIDSVKRSISMICNGFIPNYDDCLNIMDKFVFSVNNDDSYGVNNTFVDVFKLLYEESNKKMLV